MPDITGYSLHLWPPWPLAKIHNYMAVIIMRVGAKFKQQNRMPEKKREGRQRERERERWEESGMLWQRVG